MSKIAIYGAGQYGRIFYRALSTKKVKVDFFIDEYIPLKECCKKPIYRIISSEYAKVYISVARYSDSIKRDLEKAGFKEIIGFRDSLNEFNNIISEFANEGYLWLTKDRKKLLSPKLKKVRKMLSDEKSGVLLNNIIKFRETLDFKYYVFPEGKEYFPEDVPILDNLERIRFVDCGAYIGDTVREVMRLKKKVELVVSFEPDEKNTIKLAAEIKAQEEISDDTEFFIYPMGVYSKNSILKFKSVGNGSGSSITKGGFEVPVVSLDNTIFACRPNYIKIDIEGAEREAIIGSRAIINKYRPNLAISLYHRSEDLWDLPLLINEIEPTYDMYIRVHEDMGLSTVLYCIPKEKPWYGKVS